MLDPRRLHLLVELADRGTISAVADALHFTPSTVSHGLSALEREVGVPLLERSPRSVRLTPAGVALAHAGRAILGRLGAAEADARAVGRLDRGELALATFPSAGAAIVAGAVALLAARHPGLTLRLVDAEAQESIARLRSGEIDVAVVYDYPLVASPPLTGLQITHLADDPVLVCIPPRHPLADGDRVAISALRDEVFAAGRRGSLCHDLTRELCVRAGFEPDIAFETDDVAFTCALVNAGAAVAVMPEMLLATAPVPIVTRAPDPPVGPRRIFAAHRASAGGLASVAAALEALRASTASKPSPDRSDGRAAPAPAYLSA
jgi:DNA-binding transcriptional LysR family regulator